MGKLIKMRTHIFILNNADNFVNYDDSRRDNDLFFKKAKKLFCYKITKKVTIYNKGGVTFKREDYIQEEVGK